MAIEHSLALRWSDAPCDRCLFNEEPRIPFQRIHLAVIEGMSQRRGKTQNGTARDVVAHGECFT